VKSSAVASPNIAFIKYWGRSQSHNRGLNIPSNDSVSMTKKGSEKGIRLQTHTTIDFSDCYEEDTAILDGHNLRGRGMERILNVVNPLRQRAGVDYRFRMMTTNDFPTGAGLASSAAGFAALAVATVAALGLDLSKEQISTYARLGSGSAARSVHGGFVYWHRGDSHETSFAEQVCDPDDFDLNAVIAIVHEGKKGVTSDTGHQSAGTSIFNKARVMASQEQAGEIRDALLDDDFARVGQIAEKNSFYMHAVMMTSEPPLFYWHPDTLRVIKMVHRMRGEGLKGYLSIDAGPNVHVLCRPEDAQEVEKALERIEGVDRTITAEPGDDAHVVKDHLFQT